MSDNYIAVLYYALHDKFVRDNVAFYDFLSDNVHTAEDIEALCFDCDLNDMQFRMVQMNFILPKSVLSKFRERRGLPTG